MWAIAHCELLMSGPYIKISDNVNILNLTAVPRLASNRKEPEWTISRKLPFPNDITSTNRVIISPTFVQAKETRHLWRVRAIWLLDLTCLLSLAPGAAVRRPVPVCVVQL